MLLRCRDKILDLAAPAVMGILNVTPDSFSDGGRHLDHRTAVEAALRMVEAGAAIVDVGGESTRPGAVPVDAQEEMERVVPVIEALARRTEAILSVDTSTPEVIDAALRVGAHMINDVRALARPGALEAVVAHRAAVCLMHMRGSPVTMQAAPLYDDVVAEVREFLSARVAACRRAGVGGDSICIDPGIGFGKTFQHNIDLLRNLRLFTDLGPPLLVGVSRKALIGIMTGRATADRLAGSVALAALAVQSGAAIIRAHDVPATVDAVKVAAALRGMAAPD